MKMQLQTSSLAAKHAIAYLNVYGSSLQEEDVTRCDKVATFLKSYRYIYALLCMPTLSLANKKKAVKELFSSFSILSSIINFMIFLIENKKVELIPDVLTAIRLEYDRRNKKELFKISSSHPLTMVQQENLKKFVQSMTSLTVRTEFNVNKKLIVGLRVQSSSFLWERSIRKELQDISSSIAQKGIL